MNEHIEKIREGLNGLANQYVESPNLMTVLKHMVHWTKIIIEMIAEFDKQQTRNAKLKEQNAQMFDDLAGVQQ